MELESNPPKMEENGKISHYRLAYKASQTFNKAKEESENNYTKRPKLTAAKRKRARMRTKVKLRKIWIHKQRINFWILCNFTHRYIEIEGIAGVLLDNRWYNSIVRFLLVKYCEPMNVLVVMSLHSAMCAVWMCISGFSAVVL